MTDTRPPIEGLDALAESLAAFQAKMPTVHKGQTARIPGKNGATGYSYTYADLGDVVEVAMPLLTDNGLSFSCCPRQSPGGGYELVGVLLHTSGQYLEGSLPLFGNKAQDLGSALTYARRYLLGCMTGIVTDDDEDGTLAHAAQTTDQGPPPYTGPSTDAILRELDELARANGHTYADVLGPYLERVEGKTLDDLDRESAEQLYPFLEHIRTYYRNNPGTPAEAEQPPLTGDTDA